MTQQRLFRLAPVAFHLQASHIAGEGWTVTAGLRRGDESWADASREQYCSLTSEELADVICAVAESLLSDS
jgi:hypothetical protein